MAQAAYAIDETSSPWSGLSDALAPTLTLFGDAGALADFAAEAQRAGLCVGRERSLAGTLDGASVILGDIVIVDCRELGGAGLAGLVRLDERAARAGAQVIAVTERSALDDVFACCESAQTQILVRPSAAERACALGVALMRVPGSRVRELDETERLMLLRLTEEVGRLAAKLDALAQPFDGRDRFAAPGREFRGEGDETPWRPRVPLPKPRLVHQILRQRRLRDRFFDPEIFADPAWDILLDLTAARAEHRRVSVTSLCIAAAVPATTALRWIAQMTDMGILVREQDLADKRRTFIALSESAADAMARYFVELEKTAGTVV